MLEAFGVTRKKKKKHLGCYRLLGALVQMLAEKSGHGSFEVNRDRNADIEVSLSSGIAIYIGRAFWSDEQSTRFCLVSS